MNRVKQNPWAIVLVALLPVLVLGILLAALWNPMDRLDTVPAAIVNNDEPVEVDGQTAPLGRQLAAGLVDGGTEDADGSDVNYDWTVTDAEHATEGLADGTYAAVVTIPEEFSAAATSFGGDDAADARQATIGITTPPGGRVVDDALARVVATAATSVMGSTLTETYLDNVLVGFNELSDGIGEAADGAGELASGADDAASGADDLSDGAGQLADGADQLAGGAREAAGGASELAGGADQVADGASGLSRGASQLADGAGQVADGVDGITGGIVESARGADDLAAGGYQLADGADELAAGTEELAEQVGGIESSVPGSGEIQAGLDQIEQRLGGSSAVVGGVLEDASAALGCGTDEVLDPDACAQISTAQSTLAGASKDFTDEFTSVSKEIMKARGQLTELAQGTQDLADGAGDLATGTRGIADGTAELGDGLHQLADGNRKVASGASGVATGTDELATGAAQLTSGASGISAGASGLADGVGQLGTGVDELATGTDGIADGVSGLADGVDQLAGGADDLAGGLDEAADGIPTYSDGDRENLASVVADPVAAPGVDDLSTGATGPLFAVVALWLGALGLLTILPPVAGRALGSTRSALRLTLGVLAAPVAVGAGTGAAVGAVLAGVEGLSPAGWVGTILLGALVSIAFVAVHLGFLAWLGNLGRGISLLIAVLMIGTGVVATVPDVLVSVADALPTGAARDALAAAVVPEVGGLGGALTWVVLWGLVGLGLGVGAAARARRTRVAALLRA
ncbi:YhgE/Pip family protein [Isoptericola rhizosphaerae]|uniref:YhgE/Pip family protein n=1 Tax=Isoptericola rhizosphaerae TaxID=3377837 RepID=UPI00383A25FD